MNKREFLRLMALGTGATVLGSFPAKAAFEPGSDGRVNVRACGAKGDGAALDTQAVQQAIDACAQGGGGTVVFPAGRYLSGTLFFKSRVTLWLEAGAVLLGSPKLEDYPSTVPAVRSYTDNYTERSLIYGEGLERIGIEGRGVIDGQGAAFKGAYKVRPYLIRCVGCRDVSVRGVTLQDSPMWVQHYLACDGVDIFGLTVRSHCNHNNDGLDIDGCQRVRIGHCDISSGDDAIVLKSTLDRPCKDVVITNCVLSSDCNTLKLGTESNGGFENIVISNCSIYDTRLAGLALEMVDGGTLDRVNVSNLAMRDTRCPVFIRLGNRGRPFKAGMAKPGMGVLRNVSIRDVQATGADRIGCSITGLTERAAENISLDNIRIRCAGGSRDDRPQREVPENAAKYPEYGMFGELPAYGFYCRHVRGLRLRDLRIDCVTLDSRPAIVCDDVEDLELVGWRGDAALGRAPVIYFRNVRKADLSRCREESPVFLRVEGRESGGIRLSGNSLGAKTPVVLGEGVREDAVTGR